MADHDYDTEARALLREIGARAEIAVNGRWQPAPIAVVGPETRALVATALRAAERRGLERAAGVCEQRAAQWAGRIADADSNADLSLHTEARHSGNEAHDCAAAIRALMDEERDDG